MLISTLLALLLSAVDARAGEPDAADRVRDWMLENQLVTPEEPVKVWYQVDLPLEDLRIVHARVLRGGREEGGWTCFVRQPAGEAHTLWCDPESTFAGVVAAYELGTSALRLTDFDWLRFYLLAVGGGCGDASDLIAVAPELRRKAFSRVSAPVVERPDNGGIAMTIACLTDTEVVQREISVTPSSQVTIEQTVLATR